MPKIISNNKAFQSDEKRFYIPGAVVLDECPKCKAIESKDLGEEYLSFPTLNGKESLHMYCGNCDYEWTVYLKLNLNVELYS